MAKLDNLKVRKSLAAVVRGLALCDFQCAKGRANDCSALAHARNGDEMVFLCPPMGVAWEDITPHNLVEVNYSTGKILDGNNTIGPIYEIHSEIYKKRQEVKGIVHVHSPYASSLSCLKDNKLRMIHQTNLRFYNEVAYADYKWFDFDPRKEGEAMATELGDSKRVLMLGNHGVVSVAKSIEVAFDLVYDFELACKIQVLAMSTGQELRELSPEEAAQVKIAFDSEDDFEGKMHVQAVKRHLKMDL